MVIRYHDDNRPPPPPGVSPIAPRPPRIPVAVPRPNPVRAPGIIPMAPPKWIVIIEWAVRVRDGWPITEENRGRDGIVVNNHRSPVEPKRIAVPSPSIRTGRIKKHVVVDVIIISPSAMWLADPVGGILLGIQVHVKIVRIVNLDHVPIIR